jgi:hypothetical protein
LHTVTGNNELINETLEGKYKPPFYYKHTDIYGNDFWSVQGEQLVMNLSAYNPDKSIWIENVRQIESWKTPKTELQARMQVEAIITYFRELGLW